jgi:hypothetical protein
MGMYYGTYSLSVALVAQLPIISIVQDKTTNLVRNDIGTWYILDFPSNTIEP